MFYMKAGFSVYQIMMEHKEVTSPLQNTPKEQMKHKMTELS